MAETITIARPYAKAAFEYARQQKNLQSWSDALALLAKIAEQPAIKAILASPSLTAEHKSRSFTDVCGDKLNSHQQNFVRLLADNKRLNLLADIQKLFELYKAAQEKAVDVDLQTAFELDPQWRQKLVETLSRKLDRQVTLQTSINNHLIGGVLIRAGDTVIDGSVRGKLAKLAEAIGI